MHLQFVVEITLLLSRTFASGLSVHLGSNWVGDIGQLLPLLLKVLGRSLGTVLVKPLSGLLDGLSELYNIVSQLLK